jgi:transcriptional regulator with XRE-family HTH domain
MEYGNKIYELRKTKNLSQEEVANLLSVSRQSISLWETNQASPSMENLIALAKMFRVSLDELVGITQADEFPKEKADYTINYNDNKSTIFRRDYMYIKDWKEALRFFFFIFCITMGTSSFLGSLNRMPLEHAIVFLSMSVVFILIAYMVYPRYILKGIKNTLDLNYEYEIYLHNSYLSYTKTNQIKTESMNYEYKYFDYYTEKNEYITLYLLKGNPIYLPVNGNRDLKKYFSQKIEKRPRAKSFWNNR